jgi:predicted transcriptional regulator
MTTLCSEMMTTPAMAAARRASVDASEWRTARLDGVATVGEARELLRRTGQGVLIVTSGSRAVGIITMAELTTAGRMTWSSDQQVQDLLNWELVQVAPSTDVVRTLRRYQDAAWASLFRRSPGLRAAADQEIT